jgi:uncharacterized protein (DUF486 family)
VIALSVFVPLAVLSIRQPLQHSYLSAAPVVCGAVDIVFRES